MGWREREKEKNILLEGLHYVIVNGERKKGNLELIEAYF